MDTGKIYYDDDGNECSINQMVRRCPYWAANRIQEGEKAIAQIEALESKLSALQGELASLEKRNQNITDAMNRWGWSHCTTEKELIEQIDFILGELREEKIYAINCKLGNVLPSEGEIQKAYCELKEELAEREHAAMKLWIILDDIDTTSDMAKGNDSAYRERVERLQKQRFEVFTSDGYDLFLPDGTKLDPAFPTDERK